MKSQFTTLVVSSTLLVMSSVFVGSGSASFAFSMSQSCKYYNGHIADPSDCTSYGFCQNGVLLGTQKCPTGMQFDRGTASCMKGATCASATTTDVCSQFETPTFIMNPQNCTEYCYCNQNKNQGCEACPITQGFNADVGRCTWIGSSFCPLKSVCALLPDYRFASDPGKCGNYILCRGGAEPYGSHECEGDLIFNPFTGYCETNADFCSDVPEDKNAEKDRCVGETGPTHVSSLKWCGVYYFCSDDPNDKDGVMGRCPRGTHFHPTGTADGKPACVNPISSKCIADRCDNVNLSFMTVIDGTCNNYVRCQNGVSQPTKVACPEGFPLFDERQQGCVRDEPPLAYEICTV